MMFGVLGNIYLKTLRDLRGSVLAWGLGLAAAAAANVLFFPTVQSMPGMLEFLDNLPPAFKAMVGDVRAMVQLEGFLRAKLFDPLPLLLAIFIVPRGAALIAGEIELKSIDLLMARPVPRWRVALGKFLALATATVIITAFVAAAAIICTRIIETYISAGYLVLSTLNALPLTWLFGALAMFFSSSLPRARHASLATGFIVVASYMFETLRLLSTSIRSWDEVSLFAHQKAGFTLAGVIHWGPIGLLVGLVVLMTIAAAVAFERRDLAS